MNSSSSMVIDALLAGEPQPLAAGGADPLAASFVFVVGSDVSDRGVQPDRVVFDADPSEFGSEDGGVPDAVQVRPFGLDVPEEALDPRLVGRGAGPADALAAKTRITDAGETHTRRV